MNRAIDKCRKAAPILWQKLSENELKEKLGDQYIRTLESRDTLYAITSDMGFCRLESSNYNVFVSDNFMLVLNGELEEFPYVLFKMADGEVVDGRISLDKNFARAYRYRSLDTLPVNDCIRAVQNVTGENVLDQLLDEKRNWSRIPRFRSAYFEYKCTH